MSSRVFVCKLLQEHGDWPASPTYCHILYKYLTVAIANKKAREHPSVLREEVFTMAWPYP